MPWDFWLILFVLGVILPWRGRARVKKLLALPHVGSVERLSLYASTIAFQWGVTAVIAWRVWGHGFSASELGLARLRTPRVYLAAIAGAVILGSLQRLNLQRVGRSPAPGAKLLRELAARIFPQNGLELLPFCGLALTAGICEEFIYRGFVMAALVRTGLPPWAILLLSSLLFGLAHLYQGGGGFVGTAILGAVFGLVRMQLATLVPAVFWHAAVDLAAGVAGPRYLKPLPEKASD